MATKVKSKPKKHVKVLDNPATWIEVDQDFEVTEQWLAEKRAKYSIKYPQFSEVERTKYREREMKLISKGGLEEHSLPPGVHINLD